MFATCSGRVGFGASVTLDGAGSTNSAGIFQVWTKSYRYNRDDIMYESESVYVCRGTKCLTDLDDGARVRYTQSGASSALAQYPQGLLVEPPIPEENNGTFG
jgi:hypothetical protein